MWEYLSKHERKYSVSEDTHQHFEEQNHTRPSQYQNCESNAMHNTSLTFTIKKKLTMILKKPNLN